MSDSFYKSITKYDVIGWLNGTDPVEILMDLVHGDTDVRELRRNIGSWAGLDMT